MTRVTDLNMAWQLGHNAELLAHACADQDVLLACEALGDGGKAAEHLAQILPPGWATNQDTTTTARAGSAVCWRTETMELVEALPLVLLSRTGRGVRARYLSPVRLRDKATGDVRLYAAFHAPLLTTGRQAEFYRNLDAWLAKHPHAIAAGDGNRPPAKVAQFVHRRVIGTEVMCLVLPSDLVVTSEVYDRQCDAWTDHPIVRAQTAPVAAPQPKPVPVKEPVVATVEIYPGADATTQWHADDHPGRTFDANCGCIHTTETPGWPGYDGGATAPNVTAKPDISAQRLRFRQHFPIDMSSRSLKNLTGGVETNTLNVTQIELVGTCNPANRRSWGGAGKLLAGVDYIYWPDAPDWALRELAKFLTWCRDVHGIPLAGPTNWVAYPASYGIHASQRFTFDQWRAFKGWCGHQHVPENDHGDPGSLKFARLLELANGAVPAAAPAVVPPPRVPPPAAPLPKTPNADAAYEAAARGEKAATDPAKKTLWRQLRDIAARLSTRY